MVLIPRSECVISGSVALTIRVSRYLGIAPVHFTKHRDGWTIQHSPALCLYGYTLITVVVIASIFAIILDYQVGLEYSVRMGTFKDRGIWIVDISSVLLCTSVAIYSAPKKMQRFTKYFGKLQRINEDLKLHRLPRDPERMRLFFVITYFLAAIFITMIDFAIVVRSSYFEMKNMTVAVLYWFFYFCYITIQAIQIQFILNCWYVFNTFERISKGLSDLLMGKQTAGYLRPNIDKNMLTKKDVPKRSLNNIIDTIAFTNKIHPGHTQKPPLQTTSEAIRRLAVSYSETCDVVKEIDVTFGVTLLLLLGSILLHLVITPYNLITSIDDDLDNAQFSELYTALCLELLWCVFHTSNLIIIVEPCHRTEREVENIKELVSKLMHSTTCDRDLYELNLFYKHFFLNEIYYAPLKVCTLNRALVTTIMSSILTYLVVVIQV